MCFTGSSGLSAGTVGQIGTGLQVAGAAGQVMGAYDTANAQIKDAKYQAEVADNNATIAGYQAADAISRGAEAERRSKLATKQAIGSKVASAAARGVDVYEGSALNIITDTEYVGAQDALIIRNNAAKEAWGYGIQGSNYTNAADVMRARASAISPIGSAASTLLTAGGTVASSWYKNKLLTSGSGNGAYDPAYGSA